MLGFSGRQAAGSKTGGRRAAGSEWAVALLAAQMALAAAQGSHNFDCSPGRNSLVSKCVFMCAAIAKVFITFSNVFTTIF